MNGGAARTGSPGLLEGSCTMLRAMVAYPLFLMMVTAAAAERPSALEVAAAVDRLLDEEFGRQSVTPAPMCRDEDFLRRVTLDLGGTIPTVGEVTYFGLDPASDKRRQAIDRLLASDAFAQNWAAYFREVIFSRATEMRARLAQTSFENWLIEQFRQNRPWDEIVTDVLTATGDVQENGATAMIFAHSGQPEELAGEVSRVFLGIQIQCANCHDHPYDAWKRADFHELAAYFPRIQVRQDLQSRPPVFTVASADFLERMERGRESFSPEQFFRMADRNRDGKLTKEEVGRAGPFAARFEQLLAAGDKDRDGALSMQEYMDAQPPVMQRPGRGSAEYYMPDLENPSSRGTLITPRFFVDKSTVRRGTSDLDRRRALAAAITDPGNPWFARAFVNRIWTELLGEGFYTPVDDLGPQRQCRSPEVLDALCDGFVANDYDIQWLFRTICNTQAYQREVAHRSPGEASPAFAAAVPTRLRSDQVYSAVQQVLGIRGLGGRGGMAGMMGANPGFRGVTGLDAGRLAFFQHFNYDPSTPQEDIIGTVPQALFMMNSPLVQQFLSAGAGTVLGQTLRTYPDDRDALSEVYLRVLSREPTDDELAICLEHIAAGSRQQAYEDILWSLLNSSEFLTRR